MSNYFSKRIYNLNFILILMIVVLHSSLLSYSNSSLSVFFNIISSFCDMATPTFFVISAYLFYRDFDLKKYKYKLKKRVKSLVIPYFLWSVIFYIIYFSITKLPYLNSFFNNQFDFSLNALPQNIIMATCAMTLWFVRVLIIYVIVSPVLYLLVKNKYIGILIIIISFIINLIFSFGYSNPIFWLPVYLTGSWLAIHKSEEIEKKDNNFSITKFFLLLFCLLVFLKAINVDKYSNYYYLYRCVSPIFIYLLFNNFFKYSKKIKFYNYSFWIFCTHLLFVQVIKKTFIKLLGLSTISMFFTYIITIVLSITFCIVTAMLMKKISPVIYKMLIGGRVNTE